MAEKIEFSSLRMFELGNDEVAPVIVKVKKANYVPPGFKVRSRIDDYMFTADASGADLRLVQQDPEVESISISKKLKLE